MDTYSIVRFHQNDVPGETIMTGLTLEEAQAHCRRPDTKGNDWFDGYEKEFGPKVPHRRVVHDGENRCQTREEG